MAQQGESGNGRVLWWVMGIFASLVIFGATSWAMSLEGRLGKAAEKGVETDKNQTLILYRLDTIERTTREQGDDLRAIRRVIEDKQR